MMLLNIDDNCLLFVNLEEVAYFDTDPNGKIHITFKTDLTKTVTYRLIDTKQAIINQFHRINQF